MVPTIALLVWPLISLAIFAALGRPRGLVWSVMVGYLFLPEAWALDFPGLPPLAKHESIVVGLMLGMILTQASEQLHPRAEIIAKRMLIPLIVLLFLSPMITILTNQDPIFFKLSGFVIPGLRIGEFLGMTVGVLVAITPYLMAWRYLFSPEMHREILKAIVALAMFYSLFALYEVRMSPQIHNMVYGYFPHSFEQHVRGGAFRPLVFLPHGLELGFFFLTAALACIGLIRTERGDHLTLLWGAVLVLALMLLIGRNLGALVLGIIFGPILFLLSTRWHIRIALVVAVLFVSYPLTRTYFTEPLLAVTQSISEDRYLSLNYRFINERLLLDRAAERPIAGWGPWGRARIYNEEGRAISVADGYWIIVLGTWGWLGFLATFGLLILPLFLIRRATRFRPPDAALSALVLMIAVNLLYLIPNATLSPVAWMVAGALAGYAQYANGMAKQSGQTVSDRAKQQDRTRSRYTRFPANQEAEAVNLSRFG